MHVRTLTGGLAAVCLASLALTGGQAAAAPHSANAPAAAQIGRAHV